MRQLKITAMNGVAKRIAIVACVAALGVGAAACGDNSVTPQSPTVTGGGQPAATTPAAAAASTTPAPAPTTSPQSGGAGF